MRGLKPNLSAVCLLLLVVVLGVQAQTLLAANQHNIPGKHVFLPVINSAPPAPPATVDLQITTLNVSQSIQDRQNGVPLVAERLTMLRVFAQAVDPVDPTNQASAVVSVTARRAGEVVGEVRSTPRVIPTQPTLDDYDSTFNFMLPPEWLSGEVVLSVTVDPDWAVAETNENNNSSSQTLAFHNVPPLEVTIVPIDYTHTPNGQRYPGVNHDPISDWLLSVFPVSRVNVSYHAPYGFEGNLENGDDWETLLRGLTALRDLEVGPGSPRVYYGLIPVDDGTGTTWFLGEGIAGLGWIGSRVSVGLDLNDQAGKFAAHEIGHNFHRLHAPCGNPGDVDPNFPYADGSIGEYGLDLEAEIVFEPNEAMDMMSYCGPEWVSDYTYEALLQDQLRAGGRASSASTSNGMLIRATIDEAGQATVEPLYSAVPLYQPVERSEPASAYAFELLAADGSVIGSYPAEVMRASEEGVSVEMLSVTVPGNVTAATLRLVHMGQVVAERPLSTGSEAKLQGTPTDLEVEQDSSGIHLSWGMDEQPALVRYSADGSQAWSVLGVDITDGQMTIDPNRLPDNGQGEFQVIVGDSAEPLILTTPADK